MYSSPRFLNRFRIYLFIEIFVVIAVMSIFRIISDKDWASLTASIFFLASTLGIFNFEFYKVKTFKSLTVIGSLLFFILSVVPILGLKLVYWKSIPFAAITFLGLSGRHWHQLSNVVYLIFLLLILIDSILHKRK